MPVFPTLKSGAVAQFPLEFSIRNQTQSVLFLDGTSQRYVLRRGLRRWKVNLSQIDEQEMSGVIDFVEQVEGDEFSFADPLTGETVPNCVLGGNFALVAKSEFDHQAELIIQEVA